MDLNKLKINQLREIILKNIPDIKSIKKKNKPDLIKIIKSNNLDTSSIKLIKNNGFQINRNVDITIQF
jgi:hypothetical protein